MSRVSRPARELDRLRAEAHRPAELLDLLLLGQQVDDGIGRLRVHLGRVRPVEPDDVARELRHRDVHPEADAEVRDPALAGDTAGEDLPLPPPGAEPAGDEHAVDLLELLDGLLVRHVLGVDPADADAGARGDARVLQRLVHGEVRVVELHVLADERDLDLVATLADPVGQLAPLGEVGRPRLEPEALAHVRVEPLGHQVLGHEVDVREVRRGEDGAADRRRRRARSCRGSPRRACRASDRRSRRDGCRCGGAR